MEGTSQPCVGQASPAPGDRLFWLTVPPPGASPARWHLLVLLLEPCTHRGNLPRPWWAGSTSARLFCDRGRVSRSKVRSKREEETPGSIPGGGLLRYLPFPTP